MPTNRSKAQPKTATQRNSLSIGEYLRQVSDYMAYPGKIKDGVLYVLYNGEWVTKYEFDNLIKKPIVPTFNANRENADKTKTWMFE